MTSGSNIFVRPRESERRVVVTGMSLISPLGLDVTTNWAGLTAGRSGISTITHFDPAAFRLSDRGRDQRV